jgi:hypothetical protein
MPISTSTLSYDDRERLFPCEGGEYETPTGKRCRIGFDGEEDMRRVCARVAGRAYRKPDAPTGRTVDIAA